MWSSIYKVEFPKSFKQAVELQDSAKSKLFAGGSYLTSARDNSISKLIDINNLIDKNIELNDDKVVIGAGATLQTIVNDLNDIPNLSNVTKFSCSSKNIRNQRTIGGEIAQKRIQSDLFTYLVALSPQLEVHNPEKNIVLLRKWDGKGVINKIIINKLDLESSGIERFAILDSAPAFMIVAVVRRALELDFVISGKLKKIYGNTMNLADFGKNALKTLISDASMHFENDQYGTVEYKKSLIATGIKRAVEQI